MLRSNSLKFSKLSFVSLSLCIAGGCTAIPEAPTQFTQKIIATSSFPIFSYVKLENPNLWVRVYIEGDGYAFNAHGRPSSDPTPKDDLVRQIAFNDPHPNVIYLARPCQYTNKYPGCNPAIWTHARFSQSVVDAELEALKALIDDHEVVLIGFSGGAQIAGLISTQPNKLHVRKIVTIAGNLDHPTWCLRNRLSPLKGSLDLGDYRQQFLLIPQIHYVGQHDQIIDPKITVQFIEDQTKIRWVPNATHNKGWEAAFKDIWHEN